MKKILFTLLGAVLIGSAANSQFNNDDYGIYLRGTNYHMQIPQPGRALKYPAQMALGYSL